MSQKKAIDSIIKSVMKKMEEEIGALLGVDVLLSDQTTRTVSKEEFFSSPREKSVLTKMEVAGNKTGASYIVSRLEDSIFLGGTLMMIPPDEISNNIKSGVLDDEGADAFGEVANIVAGVFTTEFFEESTLKLRFTKTSVEAFVPAEVDMASPEPFPPESYYMASCSMKVEDQDLGNLEILVPPQIFDLEEAMEPAAEQPAAPAETQKTDAQGAEAATVESDTTQDPAALPAVDTKIIEATLKESIRKAEEEISTFLGQEVNFTDHSIQSIVKEGFFSLPRKKSVLTKIKISGDQSGEAYMVLSLEDAITLGGTLIMLPPDQLYDELKKDILDGECADAFDEVTNLLLDAYTHTFQELFPCKLHFKKDATETFSSTSVDPASAEPFPAGEYFLSTCAMTMEDYDLGQYEILFPPELLGIQSVAKQAPPVQEKGAAKEQTATSPPAAEAASASEPGTFISGEAENPIVVIVADDPATGKTFTDDLTEQGYDCQNLDFQENFKDALREKNIGVVFLVMSEVGERGFATEIKIKSALKHNHPLVIAGPQWTKSAVLKAVKYGARDILMTPLTTEEILQKVQEHMIKSTAAIH